MNTDVDNYLFGSILALTREDVVLSVALSLVVLIVFALFYHRRVAVTFDETYARATGVPAGFYNTVLALLTALTIVLGMRMMGALLISSLVIFPALSSMWLCKRFSTVTICAAVVSLICYIVGLFVSFAYQTPTGASIVLANLAVFILFYAIFRLRSLIAGKRS
jgi:zinc transport system permease protein